MLQIFDPKEAKKKGNIQTFSVLLITSAHNLFTVLLQFFSTSSRSLCSLFFFVRYMYVCFFG